MQSPKRIGFNVADLQKVYIKSQNQQVLFVYAEILLLVVVTFFLPWQIIHENFGLVLLLAFYAIAHSGGGLAEHIFMKKKHIKDIDTRVTLGYYDSYKLNDVVNKAKDKLGLSNMNINIYLTGNKEVNASLVKVGLSKLIPGLNGVYINRSLLHILQPEELQSVIGHELGHATAYQQRWHQYMFLHMTLTFVMGLTSLHILYGLTDYWFFLIMIFQSGIRFVLSIPYGQNSQIIEYLCDYNGLVASSYQAAISAEMKIGKASESQFSILMKIYEMKKQNPNISQKDIIKIYEESLVFDSLNDEEIQQKAKESMHNAQQNASQLSIKGFLNYIWHGDEENEDAEEEINAEFEAVKKINRIPWEQQVNFTPTSILNHSEIETLVSLIENNPKASLFQSIGDHPGYASTHPPTTNRVLFLWYNKQAA